MPFSHHSHSGQFCGHATNTLEEVVQTAIMRKMQVFAMTEHMPRDQDEDLYPGEVSAIKVLWAHKLMACGRPILPLVLASSKISMTTIARLSGYGKHMPRKSTSSLASKSNGSAHHLSS